MTSFEERVRAVLESLRPMLHADGGDIELVLVDEGRGRVEVRLKGACSRCAASLYTLSMGVESRLKQEIPSVREVVHV
jgi:Fe-S cluster biogenesis protein NfuA